MKTPRTDAALNKDWTILDESLENVTKVSRQLERDIEELKDVLKLQQKSLLTRKANNIALDRRNKRLAATLESMSLRNKAAKSGSSLATCSASSFRWERWIWGWLISANYDREGWWITDSKGYRNTLTMAFTISTDASGQKVRRVTAGRLMVQWAFPQNSFIEPHAAFAGDEQHNQNHEHTT